MTSAESVTAVIFDMDGVLVDGEPLHQATIQELLAEDGITLDAETYRRFMGTTLPDIWGVLSRRYPLPRDFQDYQRRYDQRVLQRYATQSRALPGAAALLQRLRAAGVRLALASSSQRRWVETALAALGFRDYFAVIVAGDEVRRGKPDPEIYRTVAARLGADPAHCLVIEDAPAGVAAAHAAGMRVVALRTELNQRLALPGADRIISSLEALDLAWVTAAPSTTGAV